MTGGRLDPELQRQMSEQPQALQVEVAPGVTVLAPYGADLEEVRQDFRRRFLGEPDDRE